MTRTKIRSPRRSILKGTLALAAAPAIITPARAQQTITWKVQTQWPKASVSFAGSGLALARKMADRTDGRLRLEMLGAGELAKGGEIFHFVRRGVVPMGATFPGYNLGEATLLSFLMGVPGTLREPWEMTHMVKNLGLEDALNEELEPKGVFVMTDKAVPLELVLKHEIDADTNLSAVKVSNYGTVLEYLAGAGFAAQSVDGSELYQALATGVLDGAAWGGTQGALSIKLWEVAKYHMKPALVVSNDMWLINTAAFRKLPDDLQRIFSSVLREHYFERTAEYQHLEAIARNTGVTTMGVKVRQFPDSVMSRFAQASQKILDREMAKSPQAKALGDKLQAFMKDLGYV